MFAIQTANEHACMTRAPRAPACLLAAIMTVVWIVVYHLYTGDAPSRAVAATVTTAAALLTWLVTALN
jgi:hypothetical protein